MRVDDRTPAEILAHLDVAIDHFDAKVAEWTSKASTAPELERRHYESLIQLIEKARLTFIDRRQAITSSQTASDLLAATIDGFRQRETRNRA